jgi:hypothetical protein
MKAGRLQAGSALDSFSPGMVAFLEFFKSKAL